MKLKMAITVAFSAMCIFAVVSCNALSYTVKNGDSITSIAHRYHVKVHDLVAVNNLQNPHKLKLGQQLVIPVQTPPPAKAAVSSTVKCQPYTVKETDNLWSIARKFNTGYKTLAELNGLDDPNKLKPGMTIKVPDENKSSEGMVLAPAATVKSKPISAKDIALRGALASLKAVKRESAYQVQSGDTVWSIARKFHVSWKELAHINGLNKPDSLKLNMTLKIPGSAEYALPKTEAAVKPAAHIGTKWAEMNTDRVIVRAKPLDGDRIALADRWTKVQVGAYSNGWYRVKLLDGRVGWVRSDLLDPVENAPRIINVASVRQTRSSAVGNTRRARLTQAYSQRVHTSNRASKQRYSRAEASLEPTDNSIVRSAYSYRGVRYKYGQMSSRAFDCSGFVKYVYSKHGVSLPRTSKSQAGAGVAVNRNNMKPGDIILFHTTRRGISHAGIYVGNNKFIHASSGAGRVRVDRLDKGYYSNRIVAVRRVQNTTSAKSKKTTTTTKPKSAPVKDAEPK